MTCASSLPRANRIAPSRALTARPSQSHRSASMFNLINDALFAAGGKPLGYVTPLLYSMFQGAWCECARE